MAASASSAQAVSARIAENGMAGAQFIYARRSKSRSACRTPQEARFPITPIRFSSIEERIVG
jgi:hypothetical protein